MKLNSEQREQMKAFEDDIRSYVDSLDRIPGFDIQVEPSSVGVGFTICVRGSDGLPINSMAYRSVEFSVDAGGRLRVKIGCWTNRIVVGVVARERARDMVDEFVVSCREYLSRKVDENELKWILVDGCGNGVDPEEHIEEAIAQMEILLEVMKEFKAKAIGEPE